MTNNDLDRVLSREEAIVPSSGFAESVMAAVRAEAAAPPPIPFPWKRVAPACCAAAAMLVALIAVTIDYARRPPAAVPLPDLSVRPDVIWPAFAVVLAVLSLFVSLRLARRGV